LERAIQAPKELDRTPTAKCAVDDIEPAYVAGSMSLVPSA
jgi:hypothetical protein